MSLKWLTLVSSWSWNITVPAIPSFYEMVLTNNLILLVFLKASLWEEFFFSKCPSSTTSGSIWQIWYLLSECSREDFLLDHIGIQRNRKIKSHLVGPCWESMNNHPYSKTSRVSKSDKGRVRVNLQQ